MNFEELGFLALNNNDNQEAINIFRRALEKKKSADGFIGLGIAHYNLEDYQTARWAFYKALEMEPDNKEILIHISNVEKIKKQSPLPQKQSLFRAAKDYLEILSDGKWSKFFVKGMNIGLGIPGYFPGEYPIKKGTYLKWFEQMADIGINALRNYTVHPPSFYEALYQFNQSGKKLYLFQGIWVELPEGNNFYEPTFNRYVQENIKNAVDVIYGNASLPEKPGYAHGTYEYDISSNTIGFIFGREWESCAVKNFNELRTREIKDFKGEFLSIHEGTPFEIWIVKICDFLQSYEYEKYKTSHALSAANWPTLDPLYHPSESRYEEELLLQGLSAKTDICNENEDMESLDVAKIRAEKGGGFFATYHAYPYYPDFMNNDYLDKENTFLAYLKELKNHHGNQPVLVAEFGVPSCREVAHWHRDGWHHGGHNELRQGEINGLLMKTIYKAGMAGGILFSLYDEWFKKNWLFIDYYIPADRKAFWFNIQDAEENYGLLAMYPGYPQKKVSLTGKKEEWKESRVLYEKKDGSTVFKFNDGFDKTREFKRLLVQHDEGFIYILIEINEKINFTEANYLIGLDTCRPQIGEFLLPFNTKLISPIGLKFLIHLAGKEKSRILVCHSYDKYLNWPKEIKPVISKQGCWVMMKNEANKRRVSKDGKKYFPSRVFSMSRLQFGSLNRNSPHYNSLADFFFTDNIIELRIPWGLINFTDPSSKMVLWRDKNDKAIKSDGIKIIAVSYKPVKNQLQAENTGLVSNITDSFPQTLSQNNIATYSWNDWVTPIYHTYLKESYYKYKEYLSQIPEVA
ncbi:MAG: hypothetical protein QME78_03920 [Thermodesulfobacteriota bacterium]|nr:hypothetical protein [Thermodesulfobacteriota bacterium]